MTNITRTLVALGSCAALAACTMKNQEAPPLTGPAEYGLSVNVAVSPDVLTQDGASQSIVVVTVRDSAGQPKSNVPMRTEIRINGLTADFGSLSSKSIVSGSDGKAVFVYTAPASSGTAESIVDVAVTPQSSNFGDNVARSASIRLVPPGVVLPPSGLTPAFSFNPQSPTLGQAVLFSARESSAPVSNPIAQYTWNFGDGGSGSGLDTTHVYTSPGTYFVRLTISDSIGRSASTLQSVTVGQGTAPTASFTFSPSNPEPNDEVRFNAAASVAAAGRRIVSYVWDFGDGGSATGVQATRRYTQARTYNVTLTITDDVGRTSVVTNPVDVKVPEDDGGASPN